ncbi:MAG TPA: methyltransferase domain-containing protein [Azospirillaceae bacterium]|nr:methyltransferase domain-containing protein [Azospirillaceae bacterium]
MAWDPAQYDKFRAQRERPAIDLLAAIPAVEARTIVDLGCGTGALARRLAARWPTARITGVDASDAMLAKAAAEPSRIAWVQADIAAWRPDRPVDLIVSNAALHWLPDHACLFPHLMAQLAPGGILAVQMPRNGDAPSHRSIHEIAAHGPWADRLRGKLDPAPVAPPEFYHDLLAPRSAHLDIWETTYLQVLEGEDPVLEWVKGTTLLPVASALADTPDLLDAYTQTYGARLRAAYSRRSDGTTLFPFRRLFLVARVP